MISWTLLSILFAYAVAGGAGWNANRCGFPNYTVSVFVDLGDDSPLVNTYGTFLNVESVAISPATKRLIGTRYGGGSHFNIQTDGTVTETKLFDQSVVSGEMVGIAFGDDGDRYICVHSVFPNGTATEFNGVWRFKNGATMCSSTSANPNCIKIFPRQGENLLWPNGIVVTERYGKNIVYVTDPPMGNIWVFEDKGLNTHGTIFTGTDVGSVPNFMKGTGALFPVGTPFNPVGRGFGCNGLTYDPTNKVLYTANGENAAVVSVKIKSDGTAGTQKLVGSSFLFQYVYDGVHYRDGKLYVTLLAEIDLLTFSLMGGNKVLGYNLKKYPTDWQVVIDHPLLGTPTDITDGCGFGNSHTNCNKFYIADIAGEGLSPLGPNILVATPVSHHWDD